MLFAMDPTRLDALLNALSGLRDPISPQLGEVAFELAIEYFGLELPSAMHDFLRQNNVSEAISDAMVESISLKIRHMGSIQRPAELRELKEDGKYVRYVRIGESSEWKAIQDE